MVKKILIAEDEVVMRSMLSDYLQDFGYEIIEAENGAIAWEMWKKHKCDILVTDINMPDMNGIQLLQQIKEVDKAFPVIVVTGVAAETAKSQAIEFGADVFLAKPFKMKDLIENINKILQT